MPLSCFRTIAEFCAFFLRIGTVKVRISPIKWWLSRCANEGYQIDICTGISFRIREKICFYAVRSHYQLITRGNIYTQSILYHTGIILSVLWEIPDKSRVYINVCEVHMNAQNEGRDISTFWIANLSMVTEDSFYLSKDRSSRQWAYMYHGLFFGVIFKIAKICLHGPGFWELFGHFRIKTAQFEVVFGTILTDWWLGRVSPKKLRNPFPTISFNIFFHNVKK